MKFTDNPNRLQGKFDQEGLLHRITKRIRQSLELEEILAATVVEVRSYLDTDRVKVYRFDTDGNGEVCAESIHENRLPSLVGLHFPANDIPLSAREMYLNSRQRTIVDVPSRRIGVSPLVSPETGESVKTENIRYREVDSCHIEYLKAMGVMSSVVVPILDYDAKGKIQEPRLWGLLVSHHSKARTFLKRELKVMQLVADQVSIAIAQSSLLAKTRAGQLREATINKVTNLLHTLPTIQLQSALETTIAAFKGSGGRLYIESTGELYTWGEQPKLSEDSNRKSEKQDVQQDSFMLEKHPVWRNWVTKDKNFSLLAVCDLYKEDTLKVLASNFKSTRIRGLLIIPLYYRQKLIGTLSAFRDEYDAEILWAGRHENNQRQALPTLSFEAWRELKRGQASEWESSDISLAQALGHHFSMAIQQMLMYSQVRVMYSRVQTLNANLERQVEQRTAELQKSLQLASVVKRITDQIRSTLKFENILQTIVKEVRQILKADRIVIYQLSNDLDGEVIFEDVGEPWNSVLGVKAPLGCFPDEYARLYYRGRIRAVNNVSVVDMSPCHREFLEGLQVQANLTVPINMGEKLWGLLIAHQCDAPRDWQDDEIDLLQQLADQAAVAIGQAKLYEASCAAETKAKSQAERAEEALFELKQAQTQLIQSEKMSGLGQLVAGVAHEINNPVNFIYGNLSHAISYTKDILKLLKIYQTQYSHYNAEVDNFTQQIDLDFIADDLPKLMSSMQVGAERIRSIVLSLRSFSRLDESEMKAVDIHEGIENTLVILEHRLKPKFDFPGIKVIKEYGDLPLVECYAGQMNQVFMNVLSNAIDALMNKIAKVGEWENYRIGEWETVKVGEPEDVKVQYTENISLPTHAFLMPSSSFSPCIHISTVLLSNKSDVVIIISDNGAGMSEEVKKRIFDPFFTTKPVGKGTGLGLAISYQIIADKHGGILKCTSESGKGTEFWLQIPVKPNSN
jgi:light-regulated signal transduction histidine kinase (bacteriophytochrome)